MIMTGNVCVLTTLLLAYVSGVKVQNQDICSISDAKLKLQKETICASIGGCPAGNVTAEGDWPNQAIYMQNLLSTLVAPSTCLNTSFVKNTVEWLEVTDPNTSSWWSTWVVFQVGYYDMPRKQGERIESPATLGRKCWAFAYLAQIWKALKPALTAAMLRQPGLTLNKFIQAYDAAVPLTLALCDKVMANCFKNATYNPSAYNTTCPNAIGEFYVGFEWENGSSEKSHRALSTSLLANVDNSILEDDDSVIDRNDSVVFPFARYTQTDAWRESARFSVNTALNFII